MTIPVLFKDLLESLPLSKLVSLRPVDGSEAIYDVVYLGDPNEIQLLALKRPKKFRLFGLRAKNKSGNDGIIFTF